LGGQILIGALTRAFDRFRGSGEAAVTIPSMDGAFRPNHLLETAFSVLEITEPDNLAWDGRRILFSSGSQLLELKRGHSAPNRIADYEHPITAVSGHVSGVIGIGLASGEIVISGGAFNQLRLNTLEARAIRCPTALHFIDFKTLLVCLGSQQNDPTSWTHDLLQNNCSGSVWRVDLLSRDAQCLADGLAWPNGLISDTSGKTIVAEAWRHQVVDVSSGKPEPMLSDIPGYPGRISAQRGGGYWLSIFAPRSQLIEFVLREPRFCERMMRDIDSKFWVAPALHRARDYREPLQAGAIKHLGELKPWAPSRSYGLIARVDTDFSPTESFHSRADGQRHGITSCMEVDEQLLATSRGGNLILALEISRTGRVPL
jgi:hypothetical protein